MKAGRYILGFMLVLAGPASSAEIDANLPDFIKEGFEAYSKQGRTSCWNLWTSYLRKTNVEFVGLKDDFDKNLTWARDHLGSMLRAEHVQTDQLGQSYKIIYALWGFERGAIFIKFHCYQTKDGWQIKYFNLHPDPERLLPNRLGNPLPNHELRLIR